MLSIKTLSISSVIFGILLLVSYLIKLCSTQADDSFCWIFRLVPYTITPGFTPHQRKYIKQQIDKINKQTCIYWTDMDETESLYNLTSFVRFEKVTSGPCETRTSYPAGIRVLIRLTDHCFTGRHVLHEVLHALGFDHEQQRVDRDCYVWVSDSAKKSTSNELNTNYAVPNLDRFPYDKLSIMHYRRSSNLKALSERFYQWEPLGNDKELLTDLDLWKIEYRFCGRPHYCEVHPQHCRDMDQMEADKNCVAHKSR